MPSHSVFQWRDGRGWLIFAGGATSEIRGVALNRSAADGGVACISISDALSSADDLLDDLEDLGAPAGYIVDLNSEEDATISDKLSEAGIVVISSDWSADRVRSMLIGAALDAVSIAYENGAVVLCEGTAALVFGEWLWDTARGLIPSFAWVRQTIFLVGDDAAVVGEFARDALREYPSAVVLGIDSQAAVAFGANGQVEPLGNKQVRIGLGTAYSRGV